MRTLLLTGITIRILLIVMCLTAGNLSAQYEIEKVSLSSGGGDIGGGNYTATTTVGQVVAGGLLISSQDLGYSGFWGPGSILPTAAPVEISGRVMDSSSRGVRLASITLIDTGGNTKVTLTNTFGYYKFRGVPSGASYVLSVSAKRYTFSQSSIFVNANDNLTGVNFVADLP